MEKEKADGMRRQKDYNTRPNKAEKEGSREMKTNADTGPAMKWGEHKFDKGYESDSEVFDRSKSWPADKQRGNQYVTNNKEIISRDSMKLKRSEFTKIA
jgi:hypothetical protein